MSCRWCWRWVLAGLAVAGLSAPARSATMAMTRVGDTNIIKIWGPSVAGDSKTFDAIADKVDPKQKTIVLLSGPGGIVIEGLRIGVAIHRKGWATKVDDGQMCLSTCAFTWLSGQPRIASSDAHIGFHAPFDKKTFKVDEIALHVVKTYASVLGLADDTVAFIIAKTPGEGLDWLDPTQAKAAGLALDVVPSKLHARGHFSSAMVDASDTVAARARDGGAEMLLADLKACYAAYVKTRIEAQGFKCFSMELFSSEAAKALAKTAKRAPDSRFSTKAGVKRLVAALNATKHTPRSARVLLDQWQRDLTATASMK